MSDRDTGEISAGSPPHTGIRRRTYSGLIIVVLAIVVAALLNLVHLPYAIFRPGPATNTLGQIDGKTIITIKGAPTYPTTGTLDFTTVSLYGGPRFPVNGWDLLTGWLDSSSEIVPEDQVFPQGSTETQITDENTAAMKDSQQEAMVVALRAIGKKVPEDVSVAALAPDAPAQGVLKAGDVIRSVGGIAITDTAAVKAEIEKRQPGSTVSMAIERSGKDLTVAVPTGGSKGRTVVGVYLQPTFHFPVTINVYAGEVGGPSAGMMFSLAMYDKLTPGAMTGGLKFAGTGTMDSVGTVGPIGGIQQKLVGARNAGAVWFLAPADNCDEVVGHIPDGLQVVKVATFDQAKDAVTAIGKGETGSLPRCTK